MIFGLRLIKFGLGQVFFLIFQSILTEFDKKREFSDGGALHAKIIGF